MKFSLAPLAALGLLASVAVGQESRAPLKNALIKTDTGYEFISYAVVNGVVVVDGDVLLGTEDELKAKIVEDWQLVNLIASDAPQGPSANSRMFARRALEERSHSYFPNSPALWPNGVVVYKYVAEHTKWLVSFD